MRPEEAKPLVPRGFGGPKFPEDVQVSHTFCWMDVLLQSQEAWFHQFEKWNGPNTVPQKCCLFDESESHYSWYKILQNKFLANEDENAYVQLEVFGDPAPTAQWFRVTNRGVDYSSEVFTSWWRWAVKMTGTFLRAIDISSGPMELMGENETPKGFFCNTTICKTHTGRSFWAWRSARKQTRAFTGLKKENTLTIFFAVWKSNKVVIWHQVCYLK